MKTTHDKDADAIYLYLSDEPVANTVRVNDTIVIDTSAKNTVVGIEILEASSQKELIERLKSGVETTAVLA